jgi:hypothetical protein
MGCIRQDTSFAIQERDYSVGIWQTSFLHFKARDLMNLVFRYDVPYEQLLNSEPKIRQCLGLSHYPKERCFVPTGALLP